MAIGQKRPLYIEVIDAVEQKLSTKEWDVGDKIPPEDELSELFGVSRATLREAISYLIQRGVLERRRGIGTFVCAKIEGGLETLISVTQWIRQYGYTPGTKHVEFVVRAPTRKERQFFRDWDLREVGEIRRVRTANEVPVMYCVDVLPVHLMPSEPQEMGESLLAYLEGQCGEYITTAQTAIYADLPSAEVAEKLEILVGTPLLQLQQIHYNQAGSPIFLSYDGFLANRFRLEIFRRRL